MIFKGEEAEYALSQMVPEIEDKLNKLNLQIQDEYVLGLKTAYVETLELIQQWEKHALYGLDYNIEVKYPLTFDVERYTLNRLAGKKSVSFNEEWALRW